MTKTPTFLSLAEIMDGKRALSSLLAPIRRHAALHSLVRRHLPAFLAEHCVACVNRDGQLIVFTDSPVWATQLRFVLPGMLSRVQSEFDPSLRQVKVRVVYTPDPIRPSRAAPVPMRSVIEEVNAAAACCPSPELRAALQRLTATWRRRGRGNE